MQAGKGHTPGDFNALSAEKENLLASLADAKSRISILEQLAALTAEKDELKAALEKALFRISDLERLLFGTRTERFVPLQPAPGAPTLFDVPESLLPPQAASKTVTIALPAPKAKNEDHPGRKPLPAHLERQVIVLEPQDSTEGMTCIGQEVTEVLEYIAGKLYVKQYVRPKICPTQGRRYTDGSPSRAAITSGNCWRDTSCMDAGIQVCGQHADLPPTGDLQTTESGPGTGNSIWLDRSNRSSSGASV